MATTYTWTVDNMYTVQTPDPDYVVIVNWTLAGDDGTYQADIGGSNQFDSNQEADFVPYDELTETQVIGWVQTDLGPDGVSGMEANVQGQINSMITPPVSPENTPLPW